MRIKFLWILITVFSPIAGYSQNPLVSADPYLSALKKQNHQHYILEKLSENTKDTIEIGLLKGGLSSKNEPKIFIVINKNQSVINVDTLSAYYIPNKGVLFSKLHKVPDASFAWNELVFPIWGVAEAEPIIEKHQWDSIYTWESEGEFFLYLKRDTLMVPGAAGAYFEFEYTMVFDVKSKQAKSFTVTTKGDMSPTFMVRYNIIKCLPGFEDYEDFSIWAMNKWKDLTSENKGNGQR